MTEKGFPPDPLSKEVKGIDSGAHNVEERDTAWKLLLEHDFVEGTMESFALKRTYTQIVDSFMRQGKSPAEALARSVRAYAPSTSLVEQSTLCTLLCNIIEEDNPALHKALTTQLDDEMEKLPIGVLRKLLERPDIPTGLSDALSRIKKEKQNV